MCVPVMFAPTRTVSLLTLLSFVTFLALEREGFVREALVKEASFVGVVDVIRLIFKQ